jgi:hypothetical protein
VQVETYRAFRLQKRDYPSLDTAVQSYLETSSRRPQAVTELAITPPSPDELQLAGHHQEVGLTLSRRAFTQEAKARALNFGSLAAAAGAALCGLSPALYALQGPNPLTLFSPVTLALSAAATVAGIMLSAPVGAAMNRSALRMYEEAEVVAEQARASLQTAADLKKKEEQVLATHHLSWNFGPHSRQDKLLINGV